MSKILPKPGISSSTLHSVGSNVPQMWATTAALAAKPTVKQPTVTVTNSGEGVVMASSPPEVHPRGTDASQPSAFHHIAEMLAAIIQSSKLDTLTKQNMTKVIKIAKEADMKEKTRVTSGGEEVKVSAICMAIWEDLMKLYNSLEKKIHKCKRKTKRSSTALVKYLLLIQRSGLWATWTSHT